VRLAERSRTESDAVMGEQVLAEDLLEIVLIDLVVERITGR
jgi:hypothetical protein